MTEVSTIRDGLRALASLRTTAGELASVQPSLLGGNRATLARLRSQAATDATTAVRLLGSDLLGAHANRVLEQGVRELGAAPLRREPLARIAAQLTDVLDTVDVHDQLVTSGVAAELELPMRLDGSRGIYDTLTMLPPHDQARYRIAWQLQLDGLASDTNAADARIRSILADELDPSTGAGELDALLHAHGGAERLGLVRRAPGLGTSADAFADPAGAGTRDRFIDAWRAQLDPRTTTPEGVDSRVRELIARPALTVRDIRELRTLALDLGAASRLRLPLSPSVRSVVDDGPIDPAQLDRLHDAWRLALDATVRDTGTMHAALVETLADPAPLDAARLRRLQTLAIDLDGARSLGLGRVLGREPAQVLDAARGDVMGGRIVGERLASIWRSRLALTPTELGRIDDEARELVAITARGRATDAQVDRLRELALDYGAAARLGLPDQLAGVGDSWTSFHDPALARRYAAAWTAVLERPDASSRAARLGALIREQPTTRDGAIELRALALDLGGSWELGLPTSLAAEDVPALLDDAVAGTVDHARRARLNEAWLHATSDAIDTPDVMRAELVETIGHGDGALDDARAGRLLHLLVDRGGAEYLGLDASAESIAQTLSTRGMREQPDAARALALGANVQLDTPAARAMQDRAMQSLRDGDPLSQVQARLLRSDGARFRELRPELRLAILGAGAPSRLVDASPWLDDVTRGFDQVDAAHVPTAIRDQVADLLERNRMRLDGRTQDGAVDGYLNHPDYAEMGRIAANAQLAGQLAHAARPAPTGTPASNVDAVRAAAAEVLQW